jgi:hypothetical protein
MEALSSTVSYRQLQRFSSYFYGLHGRHVVPPLYRPCSLKRMPWT